MAGPDGFAGVTAGVGALLPPAAHLLLVYDGYCGVCTRTVAWVRAHDRERRVFALPNQLPGLREQVGLSKAEVDGAAWAIDREGRRYAGAAAINRTLEELGGWRALAALYRLAPVRLVEDAVYHAFARNRGRFARWGLTPPCERPGVPCLPEGR